MKRIILLTFSFVTALALVAACSQATSTPTEAPPIVEETTEVVTEAYPVETEVETEAETEAYPVETETEVTEAMDEAEELIIDRCSACHSVDRVFNAEKTAEEWDETIERMIDYGAELNDEEKALMIDWLTSPEN